MSWNQREKQRRVGHNWAYPPLGPQPLISSTGSWCSLVLIVGLVVLVGFSFNTEMPASQRRPSLSVSSLLPAVECLFLLLAVGLVVGTGWKFLSPSCATLILGGPVHINLRMWPSLCTTTPSCGLKLCIVCICAVLGFSRRWSLGPRGFSASP